MNKTEMNKIEINWDTLAEIPPVLGKNIQHGLAGPVTGIYNDFLIVAGGSNFEDAVPWQGGTKSYHDDIFVFDKNKFSWIQPEKKLPLELAYSACISTEKGVLSIGGESNGIPIPNVYLLTTDGKTAQVDDFPELPVELSSSGVAMIDNKVYLAGGLDSTGATSNLLSIDINSKETGWNRLPDIPVALSHAVVVSQSDGEEDCIYVLGGRNKSGITSTFLSRIWKYSPSKKEWQEEAVLKNIEDEIFGLSAGTGLAYGENFILLFGGDNGLIYNQTEKYLYAISHAKTLEEKQRFTQQKNHNLVNHSGFYRDIFLFNTRTKQIQTIGTIQGYTQVTTQALWWNGEIIIPGGEIRPGIRSAAVTRGRIQIEK